MPSTATVKTIHLTKDEAERAHRAAIDERSTARQSLITNAESSATAFEDAFAKLRTLNDQHNTLYRSFKQIAAESRDHLTIVRHFFAHRHANELLFGVYATGDAWAQERCGVRYDHVCRCLNPAKEQPLLKAANQTDKMSVSSKPSRTHASLQEVLVAVPTKAAREKIVKKFDAGVAAVKKQSEVETQAALDKSAADAESALAKQARELNAKAAAQRLQDEQDAKRRQQIAVQAAVDETAASVLKSADKLPTKKTTAQEAVALDEVTLILQRIIFSTNKSAVGDKQALRQAVQFLKLHHLFKEPVAA